METSLQKSTQGQQTITSLLKHGKFEFALFGSGGVDSYLESDFQEGRVTKILNFALKIKGVVGRVAHAKSSYPATAQNLERAPREKVMIRPLRFCT